MSLATFGITLPLDLSYMYKSLGACRIIGIFAQIEANSKKLPEAYTEYSEDNFFEFNEDMGKKGIIRQAPKPHPGRLVPAFRGRRVRQDVSAKLDY